MKTFVVVRDDLELRTVLCQEVEEDANAALALHQAYVRFPDPERYTVELLFGRDWASARVGYPQYADAQPELFV